MRISSKLSLTGLFLYCNFPRSSTHIMVQAQRLRPKLALDQSLERNHEDKSPRLFSSQAAFNLIRSKDC